MATKQMDLVAIIKANPGCIATIDNDCWTLHAAESATKSQEDFGDDYEAWQKWYDSTELASSDDDFKPLGDGGYGSGNCYGGDILQALAVIVGVKIESV